MKAKKTKVDRDESLQLETYTFEYKDKEYFYSVQEPSFEQLSSALAESFSVSGKLDMAGAGKGIWELCVVDYSPEILESSMLLLKVCVKLYEDYVLPIDTEIKKN